MLKKFNGHSVIETEKKSRIKLHKSGKNWVKTTLASIGLLHLFKGGNSREVLVDTDMEFPSNSNRLFKVGLGLGTLVGGTALTQTTFAAETQSTLPLTSQVDASIQTTDSAVVTSQASQSVFSESTSQVSASHSVSDTSSASQSEFLSRSLSTSLSVSESQAASQKQAQSQTISQTSTTSQGLTSTQAVSSGFEATTNLVPTSTSTLSDSTTQTISSGSLSISTSVQSSESTSQMSSDSTLLPLSTSTSQSTSSSVKSSLSTLSAITLAATGTLNNSLITVTSQSYIESGVADNTIDPFVMEYLKHTVNFTVSNTATAGDQFTYTFGTYVAPDDLNIKQYVPDPITDASGQIIATAAYNQTTKTITYTFTDYVDKYTDVTASMMVVNLIDRGTVPNSTTVTASSTFASAPAATKSIKVQYSNATKINGTSDLSGMLNYRDKINNTIEEIFYVKPLDYTSYNYYSSLDIYGYDVNTGISGSDYINSSTIIEVYKVPSTVALPTSMRITDYSQYTKITPTISYGTDMATISNLSTFNGETYLVRVVAKYDPASTDPIKISGVMTSYDYYGSGYTATVVNGLKSTSGSSTGTGTLVTYKIGNYVWQDNDKDGLQGTSSTEKPFANVKVTLTFADGTTKSVFTDATGYYQFDGLLDGQTYTVSFETPAGWLPTVSNVGTNDAVDSDGSSITVTINGADNMTLDTGFYQGPSLSTSTSTSTSKSTSDSAYSDSVSKSTSTSVVNDSVSKSTSDSVKSDSISKSTSTSIVSESVSRSTSDSVKSDSISKSTSESAYSDSISQSVSMSEESDSISQSTSDSAQSDSVSRSISMSEESDSISQSHSTSAQSESLSQSTSLSEESDSISQSTSVSAESDSLSKSTSLSEESNSLSQSTSQAEESDSISRSTSMSAESDSLSQSTSNSAESDSLSKSTSMSLESDSISRSTSESIASDSNSYTSQQSDSLSQSTSLVQESDSLSRSLSASEESDSLSRSLSASEESDSLSDSRSLSQESDSVSQSTSIKQESESLSDSRSLSQESDSVSQSTSIKQESESLSDSKSLSQESDSVSQSTSIKQESESLSDSRSLSQESDSISQSTSLIQESESISASQSLAKESDSVSQSLSTELESDSISSSESLSQESSSISESLSITVHSESVSQSESLSQESESISESLSRESNSISVSNSDSSSLSTSISQSQSTIGSEAPKVYTIGDFVWEDTNKDGIQDVGEPGIPGVTVTLTNPDSSTKTTTTDSNGYYEFTDLNDGETYTVTFETPKGYKPTVTNNGDDTKDSDGASVTVTINGANDITLDSGFIRDLHTIGDTVWEDTNENGLQDTGEPGISDVMVTLTNPDGTTVTTSTDAKGHYEFTDLPDGDYTVTFETPKGYNPTKPNTGDDTKDSDGQVVKVTVAGSDNPTIDSGFVKKVYNIGDYVWEDTNKNGIQDAGEPGISGVTVTLTYPIGSTVTTTTDANGYYEFKNLNDGETYIVTFETPKGYAPTIANTGDDAKDSDGSSVSVTIKGADDMTLDSGFVKVHTIGDTVWEDSDKDGTQDSGEPGIPGVTVTLTNPDGSTKTTTTDSNGYYEFTDLNDGETYTVTFETPDGYKPTVSNNGDDTKDSDGAAVTVTINGADDLTLDSGFVKDLHTIGDTVWEDTNKDGIQDAGEPGIPGVTVTLTNPDGTTVTTTTDANGHYEFTDLPNGDYTVTFETPDGYTPTTPNTGDDTKDSEGQVVKVTVEGNDNPTIDSGFVKETYTIGDYVWEDTNKDGIQDAGEPGIPGVNVTITYPDGSTMTTTTDSNGYYEFTELNDGDTYTVTFETPDGYKPTVSNNGDDSKDSDGATVTVTINGTDDLTLDSGFVKEVPTPDSESASESTTTSQSQSVSHTQSTSTSQSQASEAPKASETALPHTGVAENTGLYGSAALAILATLGLAGKKRKEND